MKRPALGQNAETALSRCLSMIALIGTVSLTGACGSNHVAPITGSPGDAGGAPGTDGGNGEPDAGPSPISAPDCVNGPNAACLPSGFPFVQSSFAHSSVCNGICQIASPAGTTILLRQPTTGTICLSGTNSASDGTGLLVDFTVLAHVGPAPGDNVVLKRFNADLLGITQLRFAVDRPPSGGITVSAATLHSDLCHGVDCLTFGFVLPNRITQSGTTTAFLRDFASNTAQTFDTRALDDIDFAVGPGDFDFCIRDFQLLDAAGAEVIP